MDAKQKAVELIDKFTYWNTSEAEREGIKSALIAINEIITALEQHEWQNKNVILDYKRLQNEINNL